jgi:hypothetical protein
MKSLTFKELMACGGLFLFMFVLLVCGTTDGFARHLLDGRSFGLGMALATCFNATSVFAVLMYRKYDADRTTESRVHEGTRNN